MFGRRRESQNFCDSLPEGERDECRRNILLGEILVEEGVISEDVLEVALKEQEITGRKLGETLLRAGFVPETAIARALSIQMGLDYIEEKNIDRNRALEAVKLIEPQKMQEWKIVPFLVENNTVHIAYANPSYEVMSQVSKYTRRIGYHTKDYVMPPSNVEILLHELCPAISYRKELEEQFERALAYEKTGQSNTAIPFLVDAILNVAISEHATDVHLSFDSTIFRIFFRLDGEFVYFRSLPGSLFSKVAAAIKQRAQMDPGDRIHPQDGHFVHVFGFRVVNVRVSYIPLADRGESMVLRILDDTRIKFEFSALGFLEEDYKKITDMLRVPHGLVLVTGPTGSGKTTTLYSILNHLNPFTCSMLTIEDPVEYRMPFVRQVQVNRVMGKTPAEILRHFLRHDPDVILIGEIRDEETAEIAIQAAETGHLVLSTLHTNEAPSAIIRLRDLGIPDISISSALRVVIAQRLVKKICRECKRERKINADEVKYLEEAGIKVSPEQTVYEGQGCPECDGSGYRGRTVVYEYVLISEYDFEDMKKASSHREMLEFAKRRGYRPMRIVGIEKALAGETTLEEIRRKCG